MDITVNNGWKRGHQPHTGYLAYFSTHKMETYNGVSMPKWMIVKDDGYVLYVFMFGGYHRVKGLQPFKYLRDAKYYCDVEVEKFDRGIY